jgi:hypothetical protein
MSATFFSGFETKSSALNFLLEQIYEGLQTKRSVCVVLKDEGLVSEYKFLQKKKYFDTKQIEYLYSRNIALQESEPTENYDEVHILSDRITDIDVASENIFVYTTKSDASINEASRKLYASLKEKQIELKHTAV